MRNHKKNLSIIDSFPFNFRFEPTLDIEANQNFKNDPETANHFVANDRKKTSVCAYCGDIFAVSTDRANHEKENHVDKDGNLLEITCNLCPEKFPSSIHFRRHSIDIHRKSNNTLVKKTKEPFCCDECGKTFKVNIR